LFILFSFVGTSFSQIFPNSDFEIGTPGLCDCPTDYTCGNDAGRVIDGTHPVFVVGDQGCLTDTNRANSLGAHSGTGYVYFYAGGDRITTPNFNFLGGEQLELCVWYAGPQGAGAAAQNSLNCRFSFGIDGGQVGPNVPVPTGTVWTQHCVSVTMTAGSHNFNILSGGAAKYNIWFDGFNADTCATAHIGADTSICEGDTLVLDASTENATYLWQDNSTDSTLTITQTGTYWVRVTTFCGSSTDTIIVSPADSVDIDYGSLNFCLTDPDPAPTIYGTPGGSFSINNGGSINTSTGEIDLSSSGTGNFQIIYTSIGICLNSDTFNLSIDSCPVPDAQFFVSDSILCIGECIDLLDMSTGASSWLWAFNEASPGTSSDQHPSNICFENAGIHTIQLIASNTYGSDTFEKTILVVDPIINAGTDITIDFGDETVLTISGATGDYSWTPIDWLSCTNCQSTTSSPLETTTYTATVIDSNGCSGIDKITITVLKDFGIYVPNVFTPDQNSLNDIFHPVGLGITERDYSFMIFDRWGDLIYKSVLPGEGWNGEYKGTLVQTGVYVWKLKFRDVNGSLKDVAGRVSIFH